MWQATNEMDKPQSLMEIFQTHILKGLSKAILLDILDMFLEKKMKKMS